MKKDKINEIAFEIIALSGEAKSNLLLAIEQSKVNNFDQASELIKQATSAITNAHKVQTGLLKEEAKGENLTLPLIMVHAQDHLMNTMLLKDLAQHIIDLYQIVSK